MADNDGKFDETKLLDHYCDYFGNPKGPYQIALEKRGDWKKSTAALPVEGILISNFANNEDTKSNQKSPVLL